MVLLIRVFVNVSFVPRNISFCISVFNLNNRTCASDKYITTLSRISYTNTYIIIIWKSIYLERVIINLVDGRMTS